ncbi:MAG TPA: patatin-like phospholipase family protein [Steroidobacteraceae bacterium]|nr:patatin-like phospholipase family protein [Steroidobacteraceae bacterium]
MTVQKKTGRAACFAAIFLVLTAAAPAQEATPAGSTPRPRVGLVLSGGGARGAAHIGVLKVLEEYHVPVDAIAGTSMGAVVGGLYASGLSASEIERVMTSVDWQDAFRDRPARKDLNFRRKLEDQTYLVKFPLGLKGRKFRLPRGLVQGQKLTQILRGLTLPVSQVHDFDRLAIPFRAVATDIVTGDRVVLDHGDLTTAMRASLSAPGVFAPVEADGRLLVDGGLSSNLPIDVAREMGVDVLIVVDCGFPLLERNKLDSVPTVSAQMLAILIRHNTIEQRKTLTDRDVSIDPALGDFSSLAFDSLARAMRTGEQAARGAAERLAALAVPAEEFQRLAAARAGVRGEPPVIDFLRVEPGSERYAAAIDALFRDQVGQKLDAERLRKRVNSLYGQGNLEIFDYRVVTGEAAPGGSSAAAGSAAASPPAGATATTVAGAATPGTAAPAAVDDGAQPGYGIALNARRNSWGPNYLRFGLQLQNDFEGNSSFNAAVRSTMAEITPYGGEWVVDLQVGETPLVNTEVYLPFGYRSPYFVAPHAGFNIRTLPVIDADENILAEYRVRTTDYGIDFGRELGNFGEVRLGWGRTFGATHLRVGDPALLEQEFDSRKYFGEFRYDSVDDVNFPREGGTFQLALQSEREGTGALADGDTDLLLYDQLYAHSWGRNTGVIWASAGIRLHDDVDVVRSYFPLGGFLNMSGIVPESLVGPNYVILRGIYYRQIGRGGTGFLNVPVYIGMSVEQGNVWSSRSEISFGSARTNGSLFLGLDTILGPVYMATGFDDHGGTNYYLFLGRTF